MVYNPNSPYQENGWAGDGPRPTPEQFGLTFPNDADIRLFTENIRLAVRNNTPLNDIDFSNQNDVTRGDSIRGGLIQGASPDSAFNQFQVPRQDPMDWRPEHNLPATDTIGSGLEDRDINWANDIPQEARDTIYLKDIIPDHWGFNDLMKIMLQGTGAIAAYEGVKALREHLKRREARANRPPGFVSSPPSDATLTPVEEDIRTRRGTALDSPALMGELGTLPPRPRPIPTPTLSKSREIVQPTSQQRRPSMMLDRPTQIARQPTPSPRTASPIGQPPRPALIPPPTPTMRPARPVMPDLSRLPSGTAPRQLPRPAPILSLIHI